MKRLITLILSLTLLCSLGLPAVAADVSATGTNNLYGQIDIDEEIDRAINGITDVESEDIIGRATATIKGKNGTENVPVPVDVYVTTRRITLDTPIVCATDTQEIETNVMYATTGVAVLSSSKSVTDSKEKNYVTATVTLYWIDNLGVRNELESVSGGWVSAINPSTGTYPYLTNRSVYLYANQATMGPTDKTITVSGNNFYIDGSNMPSNYWTYSATSRVEIYDKFSDANNAAVDPIVLKLEVSTPLIG